MFGQKIYSKYLCLIKNFKEFAVDSIDPGWESKRWPVTFSDIAQQDRQDFCRYCQYSSNEQKSDCLYHIYKNVHCGKMRYEVLFVEKQHMQL